MNKIRKFLVLALMLVFAGTLASCEKNCELKYTDENGEAVSVTVAPTEDKEEVYTAITALSSYAATKEEEVNFETIGVSLNLNLEMKNEMVNLSAKLNSNVDVSTEGNVYGKVDLSANYSVTMMGQSQTQSMSFDGDVYADATGAYINAEVKSGDSKSTMKNSITMLQLMQMLEEVMGSFEHEDMLPNGGLTEMPDLTDKTEALAFIEEYGVTISATSKSTVTFKIAVPMSEIDATLGDATVDVYVELDVNKFMPVSLEFNADSMMKSLKDSGTISSGKFSFKISLKYGNYNVKTLTDTQKAEYTPYTGGSTPYTGGLM